VSDPLAYHPFTGLTIETARVEALRSRADLRSAEAAVQAAALTLRAQKAQRLPVVSVSADYGGAGPNVGNFNMGNELIWRKEREGIEYHVMLLSVLLIVIVRGSVAMSIDLWLIS
jgi:hypothetical protein